MSLKTSAHDKNRFISNTLESGRRHRLAAAADERAADDHIWSNLKPSVLIFTL